jgi:hypothetical protein
MSPKLSKVNLDDPRITYYNVMVKNSQPERLKIVTKPDYPNILWGDMKKLGLNCNLKHKFIPDNYMFSDVKSRQELVEGLLSIGGGTKGGLHFKFCSPTLVKDLALIIRSLGGFARISKLHNKTNFYRVDIDCSFLNSSKIRIKRIASIEKMGIQPCAEIPTDSLIVDNFLEVN